MRSSRRDGLWSPARVPRRAVLLATSRSAASAARMATSRSSGPTSGGFFPVEAHSSQKLEVHVGGHSDQGVLNTGKLEEGAAGLHQPNRVVVLRPPNLDAGDHCRPPHTRLPRRVLPGPGRGPSCDLRARTSSIASSIESATGEPRSNEPPGVPPRRSSAWPISAHDNVVVSWRRAEKWRSHGRDRGGLCSDHRRLHRGGETRRRPRRAGRRPMVSDRCPGRGARFAASMSRATAADPPTKPPSRRSIGSSTCSGQNIDGVLELRHDWSPAAPASGPTSGRRAMRCPSTTMAPLPTRSRRVPGRSCTTTQFGSRTASGPAHDDDRSPPQPIRRDGRLPK